MSSGKSEGLTRLKKGLGPEKNEKNVKKSSEDTFFEKSAFCTCPRPALYQISAFSTGPNKLPNFSSEENSDQSWLIYTVVLISQNRKCHLEKVKV